MVNVAVLGYGTVGSGVVEVIEANKELLAKRSGKKLEVKYILDLRDFPGDPYEHKITHDFNDILSDDSIDVVCEVMGGATFAYEYTKKALEKGINVCTSNKELVAKHGPELLTIAKKNKCSYLFEASVGGGIPIIRPINEALTAERIERILGILNGTTNYILSKMEREGADFDDVLKEAQANGYAEANPAADVEGHDACRKIAILSSLMMAKNVDSEKVFTEGITSITADDFVYSKAMGKTIKLLGMSSAVSDDEVLTMVAPFLIDKDHPLAMVNDVFNAVFVTGNMVGDTMYYGRGAGKLATASAVVADVVKCAKHIGKNVPCFWDAENVKLTDVGSTSKKFFIRVTADAADKVCEIFPGSEKVAVEGRKDAGFVTAEITENDFAQKAAQLGAALLGKIRIL